MTPPRRRGSRGAICGVALLVLGAGACRPAKPVLVDFSETPRQFGSKDYKEVHERWTRYGKTMYQVDTALEVWVTYKSWEYREAYIEHYAGVYTLSAADREALRASQLEASRAAYEFHVTAQSADYKWNDLEKRNTSWRVMLLDGVGHELPVEAVKLLKLPDPYEREFFPAKTPFTRTYSMRFPRKAEDTEFLGTQSGSLTLRFASPVGQMDLVWKGG